MWGRSPLCIKSLGAKPVDEKDPLYSEVFRNLFFFCKFHFFPGGKVQKRCCMFLNGCVFTLQIQSFHIEAPLVMNSFTSRSLLVYHFICTAMPPSLSCQFHLRHYQVQIRCPYFHCMIAGNAPEQLLY